MSKGPGKWQRLLLEIIEGRRGEFFVLMEEVEWKLKRKPTPSEYSAICRAARSLHYCGEIVLRKSSDLITETNYAVRRGYKRRGGWHGKGWKIIGGPPSGNPHSNDFGTTVWRSDSPTIDAVKETHIPKCALERGSIAGRGEKFSAEARAWLTGAGLVEVWVSSRDVDEVRVDPARTRRAVIVAYAPQAKP